MAAEDDFLTELRSAETADEVKSVLTENAPSIFGKSTVGEEDALFECLVACCDYGKFHKLEAALEYLEAQLASFGGLRWGPVFDRLMTRAVEQRRKDLLHDLLKLRHDEKIFGSRLNKQFRCPPPNHPALCIACSESNSDTSLILSLVRRGYRISPFKTSSGNVSNANRPPRKRFMMLEFLTGTYGVRGRTIVGTESGKDEIAKLNLLRLAVRPAYLFACYKSLADGYDWSTQKCECLSPGAGNEVANSTFLKRIQYEVRCEKFHYCPRHPKFTPVLNCTRHLECNDPVTSCLILAKECSDLAALNPEHRNAYKAVKQACHDVIIGLLDVSRSSAEITLLMEEDSCARKYFHHSHLMRYPLLRLALEHNFKEFGGHRYCQQNVVQEWDRAVPWDGKGLLYKIAYYFVHTYSAPLHIMVYDVYRLCRQYDKTFPKVKENGSEAGTDQKTSLRDRIIDHVNSTTVFLDMPFNRFLVHLGWHLIYVFSMLSSIVSPLFASVVSESEIVYHGFLVIYPISSIIRDLATFAKIRSLRVFASFWRVLNLIGCLLVILAFVIRVAAFTPELCPAEESNCEVKDVLLLTSNALYGMAATSTTLSLLYWLQLHDRMGPLVINLRRVIFDVVTMAVIFAIIYFAFCAGITFLFYSTLQDTSASAATNHSSFTLMQDFFWALLDPGQPDFDEELGTVSLMGSVTFVVYEVIVAIVFLNLVIATMNTTIQKLEDKRELYWSFNKTRMMLDFFETTSVVPCPWNLLQAWLVVPAVILLVVKGPRSLQIFLGLPPGASTCSTRRVGDGDQHDFRVNSRRREYSHMIRSLIKRYEDKLEESRENELATKADLTQLKQELQDSLRIENRPKEESNC